MKWIKLNICLIGEELNRVVNIVLVGWLFIAVRDCGEGVFGRGRG